MQGGCNFGAQRWKLQDTPAINRDFLELLFPRPLCWIMFDAVKVETPKFRLYVIHMGRYSYKDLQRKSLFISFYLFLRTLVNDHEYMEFTSHKILQTELLRRQQQLSFVIRQFPWATLLQDWSNVASVSPWRGKENVKLFCERDESRLGGGRVTQWPDPDIGFHEIRERRGAQDCKIIFLRNVIFRRIYVIYVRIKTVLPGKID